MKVIEYAGHAVCLDPAKALRVYYVNWEGKRSWRTVFPLPVAPFIDDSHKYHPGEWVIKVWDMEKDAERDFRMASIEAMLPNGLLLCIKG